MHSSELQQTGSFGEAQVTLSLFSLWFLAFCAMTNPPKLQKKEAWGVAKLQQL